MAEPTQGDNMPETNEPPHCPWCSAILSSADDSRCPSCNAALRDTADKELPGVTSIDHEAILRSRMPVPKPSGFMGWLSGGYQDAPEPPPAPHTFSPPDTEVKREMLRMELAAIEARMEAQRAELEAELVAAGVQPPGHLESSDADASQGEASSQVDGSGDGAGPDGAAPDGESVLPPA